MQQISIRDSAVRLSGRIGLAENRADFFFPGSLAELRFRGSSLRMEAVSWAYWGSNSLGIVLDGRLARVPFSATDNGRRREWLICDGLRADMVHTCMVFKQLDCSCSCSLFGFATDGEFLPAPPAPRLRLEFYGDSVTSGACVECVDWVGLPDPAGNDAVYDNAWYSYAWQCARMLGAEAHLVSQGGIAVLNGTGYHALPDSHGMEMVWDRECYFPEAGPMTPWDFTRFVPHACVFALGQNDHHDGPGGHDRITVTDPAHRVRWKEAYKRIARGVASHYPAGTPLVFITTVLRHEPEWDDAIDEVAAELSAEGLRALRFRFNRNGAATDGHPRIPEQTEMARELAGFLRPFLPPA